VAARPRILFLSGKQAGTELLPPQAESLFDVVRVSSRARALTLLQRDKFDGIFVSPEHFQEAIRFGRLLENNRILEGMPDGVAVVDSASTVIWTNDQLQRWSHPGNIVGETLFAAMGGPEIVGGSDTPFASALATRMASSSVLKTKSAHFYNLHASPLAEDDEHPHHLVVTIRDVTRETQQRQRLDAIQAAGREMSELTAEHVYSLGVDDRKEFLKARILQYIQELLKFDVVEIRLLDPKTGELKPLLEHGMDDSAAGRALFASPEGNGVTGFVAATGISYLCEDTAKDKLYLQGVQGARSSLTVPLLFDRQTIGTFNVESPKLKGFTDEDVLFVETFCRGLTTALNTLELLAAQRTSAVQISAEEIHGKVARPIDEIVRDAFKLVKKEMLADPESRETLQRLIENASHIKEVIREAGQETEQPDRAAESNGKHKLAGRRVLVVDPQEEFRKSAHTLLEPHGCEVVAVDSGELAEWLYTVNQPQHPYDLVMAEMKLPDMTAFELLCKLKSKTHRQRVPLIFTKDFCYDPGHQMKKAVEQGHTPKACIVKPFNPPYLLEVVQHVLDWSGGAGQA
jgi:CheY-like chemotaxis protein